jgi:nucleoside-diphosphate-sugar epimerase
MNPECSLIIGSSGLIGNNLKASIAEKEHLFTISRSNSLDKNHFSMNLSDKDQLSLIIKKLSSEYKKLKIYYLAGETSIRQSILDPEDSFSKSVLYFLSTLEVLKDINCSIVFSSTGAIYDSRTSEYFNESDPLHPPSPYAASKYASEGLAMAFFETFSMDIRIARIFSVFGPEMDRFFIFDLVKKILSEKVTIKLHGNGKQIRDYLYVDHVSNGLVTIMNNGSEGEIYNISSGNPTLISELAEDIKSIVAIEHKEIIWDDSQTLGIRDSWYGNNSKIKGIGFEINKDFKEKLITTVNSISKRLRVIK